MFENIINFFRKLKKKDDKTTSNSKDAAKERLHLVLMQDRANVSADFLELMKQEIIEVIKKYIDVDEEAIDVRLTNKENEDGTNGAPALYANIPIVNIKNEVKKIEECSQKDENKKEESNQMEAVLNLPMEENMPKVEQTYKIESTDQYKPIENQTAQETTTQEIVENSETESNTKDELKSEN